MNKCFAFVFLLTLFLSCSNKSSVTPKTFKVKLGNAVTLAEVQGGITFGSFGDSPEPFFNDLSLSDFSAEVPQGISTLYMVAYSGPEAWKGIKYCGSLAMDVGSEETSISITLSTSRCANAPEYQIVMDTKIDRTKTFGNAQFGTATFGP